MTGGPHLESGDTPPRKRIAVACGRCRKRKIRCSGDPGGGQACSNCKNAGAEPCQFLRVSSQEAPLRHDGSSFDYDVAAARPYANRGVAPPASPYSHDLGSGDLMASYRGNSVYQYPSKSYYSNVPGCYSGYAEAGVDYNLGCPSYSVLNQDPNSIVPYSWPSTTRGKPAVSSGVYVDADSGYSYGSTSSIVQRPAASSETSGFSMSSFTAALPSSGADRLLPTPVNRTLPSTAGSSSYRTDGLPIYKSTSTSSPAVTSPTSLQSPAMDGSPMTSYPAGGHHRSSYGSGDAYATHESIFSEQERGLGSQGPAVDMTGYTYGGGGSSNSLRRGSSSSGPSAATTSTGLSSNQPCVPHEGPHMSNHHHVGVVAGVTTSAGYVGESATTGGGTSHADGHRGSVSSRR